MEKIDIRNIKIGGEIGRRIHITANSNILTLDVENDFLLPFKEKWSPEKDELANFVGLGKFLDAVVRLAAYTGQEELIALKDHIVAKIISMQEADGYFGMMPPEYRFNTLWDIHEQVFVILALASDYRYWKNQKSLDTACALADYIIAAWKKDPKNLPDIHLATVGLEEAFVKLYDCTKDTKYLEFLTEYLKFTDWDMDIVTGRWGAVHGHVYGYLCKANAELALKSRLYDNRPAQPVLKIMDYMLNKNGMVITGIAGEDECFQDNQNGAGNLGETCATAYWMKLLDTLLIKTGDSHYGDLMERTLYNGLFGAQSPDGRQIRYYTAFDGPRRYFHLNRYCCPNNFRRIVSELPEMVYYEDSEGIWVNLYTSSEASFRLKNGVTATIRQETLYPRLPDIRFCVEPSQPASFNIRLRIPKWCNMAEVYINGEKQAARIQNGKFHCILREWKKGDEIVLKLPMPLRLIQGRAMQKGKAAVMRGPVVYCLNRTLNGELQNMDLRLICIDPDSLAENDENSLTIKAWPPYRHGPARKPALLLTLTEFPDPDGEAVYFKVPNPTAANILEDELFS